VITPSCLHGAAAAAATATSLLPAVAEILHE